MGSLVLLCLALAFGQDAPAKVLTLREETCRVCYRECPVSCFVGTCGLQYGVAVNRFQTTNVCWSCDQAVSVGISRVGDYSICSPEESAATELYIKKKDPILDMPTVSGIGVDTREAASNAQTFATDAMNSARKAAEEAEKAAAAAVAKYNSVNAAAAKEGDEEEIAEAHRLAETIRSQDAEQSARAAENAKITAEQQYSVRLEELRKQQIITDQAEAVLERAEKAAGEARAEATKAAARAAQAARESAFVGAAAAGRAAEQAEVGELAATARAAQRRALAAASAAKAAAEKAGAASSIANVPPQPKPTLPPCDASQAMAILKGAGMVPTALCQMPANATSVPAPPAPVSEKVPVSTPPVVKTPSEALPPPTTPTSLAEGNAVADVEAVMPTMMPLPLGSAGDGADRMANAVVGDLLMTPQYAPLLSAVQVRARKKY